MVEESESASPFNRNVRYNRPTDKAAEHPKNLAVPGPLVHQDKLKKQVEKRSTQSRYPCNTSKEQSRLSSTLALSVLSGGGLTITAI